MKLEYLLERQRELDDFIIKSKGLESFDPKARLNNTALAMMVEVGEMMNEIRSFKFWKKETPIDREKVLCEFTDCLHFMLSLANQLGLSAEEIERSYDHKNKINFDRQLNGY